MKLFLRTLAMAMAISQISALGITSIEIIGNYGDSEENPIPAEEDYTLRCNLDIDADDAWSSCVWQHNVDAKYDDADGSGEYLLKCSAGDSHTDSGKVCTNDGGDNEVDGYASKVTMDVGQNFCGIKISNAEFWDNGDWECYVGDGTTNIQYSTVEVWVANMSSLSYSDPDQMDDDQVTVVYDYRDDNREIEATCRAVGAIPPVTAFKWYLDDDRTEIDLEDLNLGRLRDGRIDDVIYYEQSISWEPTIDDLCDKYDLDQEVCNKNSQKNRNFEMTLICKAEQGSYFESELDNEQAEIIVEVVDGASSVASSFFASVTLAIVVALRNSL